MRIMIFILMTVIFLTVFACSESPSSPANKDSGSSVISSSSSSGGVNSLSSSSGGNSLEGRACIFSGEEIGVSGIFACEEYPVDLKNIQAHKTECEKDGGSWENKCPNNERIICIDEEDEDAKDIFIKIYANNVTCRDLDLKNADEYEDIIAEGGACGPFKSQEKAPFSICIEFPELSTSIINISCAELNVPFIEKCPGNSGLICYDPEEETVSHFYGENISSFTCEDFDMEALD